MSLLNVGQAAVRLPERTPILLNTKEAADALGLSERTLERWRVTGGGPRYVKVGRAVRYLLADLIEWVEERRRQSTSDDGGGR
jgi:excisionase family DNA binding protein